MNDHEIENVDPLVLPALVLANRLQFPTDPVIYFVLDTLDAVRYIGQTKSLKKRWLAPEHRGFFRHIEGLRIAWLVVEDQPRRILLEKHLIRRFQPSQNRMWHSRQAPKNISVPMTQEMYDAIDLLADEVCCTIPQQCAALIREALVARGGTS